MAAGILAVGGGLRKSYSIRCDLLLILGLNTKNINNKQKIQKQINEGTLHSR